MAKNKVIYIPKTKKEKTLNVLRIIGICFGAMLGIIAAAVIYVWIIGGFNPPYVPLEEFSFSQSEYVIDDLDFIKLVPNEGCTELDAIITIKNTNIVCLVEDDNTTGISNGDEIEATADGESEAKVYEEYNVKINSDIQIKPVTKKVTRIVDGQEVEVEINVGGWVELVATQDLHTTSCWVYVDVPVESFDISVPSDVEQETDDEDGSLNVYVYPNSTIQLSAINFSPSNSMVFPSTALPYGKTSTERNKTKIVYYEVSDSTKATIDNNGLLTILESAEGSFTVNAYVITKYNDVGNEPNQQDYIEQFGLEEGLINWQEDFDKIRVKSQTITFNIKEIAVEDIVTTSQSADNQLVFNLLDKNVWIQAGNTETNKIDSDNVYHYFVDLVLSYSSEADYKSSLMQKIILLSGYIDNNSQKPDIVVNGNKIVLSDEYIKVSDKISPTVLSWKITIDKYIDSQNVLVFAYPTGQNEAGETEYIYNYVCIGVNKVRVSGISFTSAISSDKIINLVWDDSQDGESETMNLNNTVTISPSNTTYKKVMYFASKNNDVVEVDTTKKIKTTDGAEYYAICKTTDDLVEYNWLNPIKTGRTNIIAAILRVDANNDLLVDDDGYYVIEYAGVSTDIITVNVTKQLKITKFDILDSVDTSILNDGKVTVSKDDSFKIKIECDNEITSTSLISWSVSDGKQNYLQELSCNIDGNTLIITLSAEKVGDLYLSIIDSNGNAFSGTDTVYVVVESTELTGLTLSSNAENGVSVKIDNDSYSWVVLDKNGNYTSEQLEFSVTFLPENTSTRQVVFAAYNEPSGSYNLADLKPENLTESDAIEFVNDESCDYKKLTYTIKKPQNVIVFATSISGEIVSNPVLVEISLPEVKVEFSYGNSQDVVSTSGSSISLLAYSENDGTDVQGNKFEIGFVNADGEIKQSIKDFVKFKFAGKYSVDENGYLVSSTSGVKIDNTSKTLILSDLAESTYERIVMFTDFGYECDEDDYFVYNLAADYDFSGAQGATYFAPGIVDLFSDYQIVKVASGINPQENGYFERGTTYTQTNDTTVQSGKVYYQKSSPAVKLTSKDGKTLYLPIGYDYESNLSEDYLNEFKNEDDSYNISLTLNLSVSGSYCVVINSVTAENDSQIGNIKITKVPTEEMSVSLTLTKIRDDNTNGYIQTYSFTITSAVESNFEYNGAEVNTISVAGNDDGDKFIVDNNESDQYVVDLSDYISYISAEGSNGAASSEIKGIKFSSVYGITFGFGFDGNYSLVKYAKTTDTEIDTSKTYYILDGSNYVKVDSPKESDVENYYEIEDEYAKIENGKLILNSVLLTTNIQELKIILEITTQVTSQGVTAKLTDYYTIVFEIE